MNALMFYAQEDQRTQELWYDHLFTIDILCQCVPLSKDGRGLWGQLQQVQEKETQLLIILWSVNALVLFKQQKQWNTLNQIITKRDQQFGTSGIVSALARPCAYEGTMIEKTMLLSETPISSARGQIDLICLNLARQTKSYLQGWEKALKRASMTPEERALEDKYGPEGNGEQQKGDTITFEGYIGNTFSQLTGVIVYVKEEKCLKEKYVYIVQIEEEAEYRTVWPQDIIKGTDA